MGEYSIMIWFYQLSWYCKIGRRKEFAKADVLSDGHDQLAPLHIKDSNWLTNHLPAFTLIFHLFHFGKLFISISTLWKQIYGSQRSLLFVKDRITLQESISRGEFGSFRRTKVNQRKPLTSSQNTWFPCRALVRFQFLLRQLTTFSDAWSKWKLSHMKMVSKLQYWFF